MKPLLLVLLGLLALPWTVRAQPATDEFNRLLGKYVAPNGVRYAAWHANAADRAALKSVTAAFAREKTPGNKEAKIAFLTNAYNANMIDIVLDKYPVKGVRDIAPLFGVFTRPLITVSGEKMSLNRLEKEIILPLGEPRVHFALNCASASCPPLMDRAYTAGRLDADLDAAATAYLNRNPLGVKVSDNGKRVAASKIFDWYKADFQPAGGTAGFINRYRKPPLPADAKITYQEYDWSLNAAN